MPQQYTIELGEGDELTIRWKASTPAPDAPETDPVEPEPTTPEPTPEPTPDVPGPTPEPEPTPEEPTPEEPEPIPPTPPSPPATAKGILTSEHEVLELPMSGPAWDNLLRVAGSGVSPAKLGDLNNMSDVQTLATAIVAVRTKSPTLQARAEDAILACIGTHTIGSEARALESSRNIQSYVFAADLLGFRHAEWIAYLRKLPTIGLDGHSGGTNIFTTALRSPNNWGTHARAAITAIALFLDDRQMLDAVVEATKRWTGETTTGGSFVWDSTNWHVSNPKRGINGDSDPRFDGSMPEDMRRGGSLSTSPAKTGYAWEALQGVLVQAYILERAGFPAFTWGDRAILRAANYLSRISWSAEGDDAGYPWILRAAYGEPFRGAYGASPGKNCVGLDYLIGSDPAYRV